MSGLNVIRLRAPSKASAVAAAAEADVGLVDPQTGDWIVRPPDTHAGYPRSARGGVALVVGIPIVVTPAVYGDPDPETGLPVIITPAVYDERYHADMVVRDWATEEASALITAAAAHGVEVIYPETPAHRFAGEV